MGEQRFPVFLPMGAEEFTGRISCTPYNAWWVAIVLATYFTVLFVPFDIAFSKVDGGAPLGHLMSVRTHQLRQILHWQLPTGHSRITFDRAPLCTLARLDCIAHTSASRRSSQATQYPHCLPTWLQPTTTHQQVP